MTRQSDGDYYAARLRAEREAAAAATSDEVRAVHQALAARYAGLLAARGNSAALDGVPPEAQNVKSA